MVEVIMDINKKLLSLYNSEIEKLTSANIKAENIDGPLLMHCWEEEYLNSKYKILFLGREPNGWLGDLYHEISYPIQRYKEFELCENGRYTVFWQYIYDFKNILMPETIGQKNFLWSNTSKFSKAKEGTAISLDDFMLFSDNFKVLENEIKITNPDVIIFFTGSDWDEKIQYQLDDHLTFNAVNKNFDKAELSRISSKTFPFHTYRVPHPITMQIQKKWKYMEQIIEIIKDN